MYKNLSIEPSNKGAAGAQAADGETKTEPKVSMFSSHYGRMVRRHLIRGGSGSTLRHAGSLGISIQ
jgi:hypothetical protein